MMYLPPAMDNWKGRVDSETDYDAFRWHQRIEPLCLGEGGEPAGTGDDEAVTVTDALADGRPGVCLIGFACDEGVRRNLGRPGAAKGPQAIRAEAANLPCYFGPEFALYDAGDVVCDGGRLEEAQELLGEKVAAIREIGLFPIVLGGGHETALGHWLGQRAGAGGLSGPADAILNFDAHLDMRPYPEGGSSGTMFRQVADRLTAAGEPFRYLCVGVQRRSNTLALFRDAEAYGARWLLARDIAENGAASAFPAIDAFLQDCRRVMVTICADVVSSAWAPGVSAPQPLGLDPESLLRMLKRVLASGKAAGLDLSEVSPRGEGADPTASLAATLLFAAVNAVAENAGLGR